jgi:predicted Rossmann fold flavoprotein
LEDQSADVVIVGAGAAGLATAIFAARRSPQLRIVALDGARKIGAKILISGGGRCNVTNARVTEADFCGGSANTIRRILREHPASATVEFFRDIGVPLHEEEDGKLFPDSNRARTVLDALLSEAARVGVRVLTNHRVTSVERAAGGYVLATARGSWRARRVVLATGGLSYPKTGSDGAGYGFAVRLGHALTPTTPALAPLKLAGTFHTPLSGAAQPVELVLRAAADRPRRVTGALLWTHFGISGPAVLDASRWWLQAKLERRLIEVTANLLPGETFEGAERLLLDLAASRPRLATHNAFGLRLPARVVLAVLSELRIAGETPLAHLSRDDRRRLLASVLNWPLPVTGSCGYAVAEATAGGVRLDEIDPRTMESRISPGLFLVGEMLDVDGRIGGFNFQWAWSSGWMAGNGLAGG